MYNVYNLKYIWSHVLWCGGWAIIHLITETEHPSEPLFSVLQSAPPPHTVFPWLRWKHFSWSWTNSLKFKNVSAAFAVGAVNSNRVKHKNKRWEIRRRDNIIFENIYIFRETLACMHGTSRLTVTKVLQVAAIYILKRFLSERLCASCVQLRNHPVQKIYAAMQIRNFTPFLNLFSTWPRLGWIIAKHDSGGFHLGFPCFPNQGYLKLSEVFKPGRKPSLQDFF